MKPLELRRLARAMRKKPMRAEVALEFYCRALGLKTYPQHVRDHRIIDVFLPQLNIGLEADGKWHARPDKKEKDAARTKQIMDKDPNFRMLRYQNDEILNGSVFIKRLDAELLKCSGFAVWPDFILENRALRK